MAPTREGPQRLLRSIDRSIASTVLVSAFSMGRPILPREVLRISICLFVGGQHAISTVGQPKISTFVSCGALLSPLNISEFNFLVADRKPRDFHPRLSKKKATERNHARSKGIRTRIDSQFHPLSERSQAETNAHTTKMRRPTGRSELAGSWAGNRLAPRPGLGRILTLQDCLEPMSSALSRMDAFE